MGIRATRAQLTQICARIIVQEGVIDYQNAKKRAATQLGLLKCKDFPSHQEIEQAVYEYQ